MDHNKSNINQKQNNIYWFNCASQEQKQNIYNCKFFVMNVLTSQQFLFTSS